MSQENLERQVRRLATSRRAREALSSMGLRPETVERFELGLKAPYRSRRDGLLVEDALSFPIKGADGVRLPRFGFVNLDGVTSNPVHDLGWGTGPPLSYWSAPASASLPLLVVEDALTLWSLHQAIVSTGASDILVLAPSHPGDVPFEWTCERFWADWPSVTLLVPRGDLPSQLAAVGTCAGRDVVTLEMPDGAKSWHEQLRAVGDRDGLHRILMPASGASARGSAAASDGPEVGFFPYEPVDLASTFLEGNLYYPFKVERRQREVPDGVRGGMPTLVLDYTVRVLRSDGRVLDIEELPSSGNVSAGDRVLALADGTRILRRPEPSDFSSWRFASIAGYARRVGSGRDAPHRPLARIADDLEATVRASVVLPEQDDYAVVVSYVLLSYVYQVFEAVPLLLVQGPKGSGKTELGQVLADLSCNAVMVGQSSAAGIARLVDELRGLLVVDDLESVARATTSNSNILQLLKVAYKRASASKPVVDRSGRVRTLHAFGPKVVTNTKGVEPILASRMVTVGTRCLSEQDSVAELVGADPGAAQDLRDELHCWGMAQAGAVAEAAASITRWGDRRDEIERPLRVLGSMVSERFVSRLGRALARDAGATASVDLSKVVLRLLGNPSSPGWLSISQLQLEVALAGGDAGSPESLGRMLADDGFRREGEPIRRRLHGMLCRIVPVLSDGDVGEPEDALSFCRARSVCESCRYVDVCPALFPALGRGKDGRAHGPSS